ncbi:MAG: gamma-glutamyltransferase [Gemmatimonadetes bacterium]|nr:gamma-glutamyltransferase [Gemmatimonadota bacterium]
MTRTPAALRMVLSTVLVVACSRWTPTAADLSPADGKRVEGDRGMVASSHPDASAAGIEILRAGGNAADAAVAIGFALSVTDISQTGLGGGGALTFYDARAGKAGHLSFYPRTGRDPAWAVADTGPVASRPAGRAAGVPGMVAGLLETQRRFGRLTRAQVMAPAIRLARDGFVVSPLLSRTIAASRARLEADTAAQATFFHDGAPLGPGDRLVQPRLAATLERIAQDGADGFYKGGVAARLAQDVRSRGGLITTDDMARYTVAAMIPLCAEWRGLTVLSAPPPMGGSAVLEMLQLAEASGLTRLGGYTDRPAAVTAMAGVLRTAQADAGRWRGDPFTLGVPARGVSSASYAIERAREATAPARDSVTFGDAWAHDASALPARCAVYPYASAVRPPTATDTPKGPDAVAAERPATGDENTSFTSHLSVVDAEGNAVSATTTVGVLFGSGVYSGGFFLNSSAANFDARTRGTERYSNSTMAPTMILDGPDVRLVIGAAGSQYIQPAITQVTVRILAYGEDPGRAITAPRIQTSPGRLEVEVEPGFSTDVYAALVAAGYRPVSRIADITFGGVHGVYVRPDGKRIGIADPRRDGVARRQ